MIKRTTGPRPQAARRTGLRSGMAAAVASALIAAAGCGGVGENEQEQASRGAIGEARAATNGSAADFLGGSSGPRGGVVQGEPPGPSADAPAAVGAPRRSCTGGELEPSPQNLRQVASVTLCLLNVERDIRGLRPLRSNNRLAAAARAHSRDMVRQSYFDHDSESGASFVDRIKRVGYLSGPERWFVGENLAWGGGARATPRAIVQAWMASPPHRANILQRRFREIGIGVVIGAPVRSGDPSAATYSTDFGARV